MSHFLFFGALNVNYQLTDDVNILFLEQLSAQSTSDNATMVKAARISNELKHLEDIN